jgi:hypothetical protein
MSIINQMIPDGKVGVMRRRGSVLVSFDAGKTAHIQLDDATDTFALENVQVDAPPTQQEIDRQVSLQSLALLDQYAFKIVDALMEVLVSKKIVDTTDFPPEMAALIAKRKALLSKLQPSDYLPK